jgi:hypothetical protein
LTISFRPSASKQPDYECNENNNLHYPMDKQLRYVAMSKLVKDFSATAPEGSTRSILMLAAWFGLVAGLVEGAGLLLFQRINWGNWGHTAAQQPEVTPWACSLIEPSL